MFFALSRPLTKTLKEYCYRVKDISKWCSSSVGAFQLRADAGVVNVTQHTVCGAGL